MRNQKKPARPGKCSVCGRAFLKSGQGQVPQYCSPECKRTFYRAYHKVYIARYTQDGMQLAHKCSWCGKPTDHSGLCSSKCQAEQERVRLHKATLQPFDSRLIPDSYEYHFCAPAGYRLNAYGSMVSKPSGVTRD